MLIYNFFILTQNLSCAIQVNLLWWHFGIRKWF